MSFEPGDRVLIERDGEWEPGRVVARKGGGYRVSYDPQAGYEDLEDEDVGADQVRAPGTVPAPVPLAPRAPVAPRWIAQAAQGWRDCPRPALERLFERVLDGAARALRAARSGKAERAAVRVAIGAFYDAREAAGQPRGELAIHFFWVDGVGLDGAHATLHQRLDDDAVDRWRELFVALVDAR